MLLPKNPRPVYSPPEFMCLCCGGMQAVCCAAPSESPGNAAADGREPDDAVAFPLNSEPYIRDGTESFSHSDADAPADEQQRGVVGDAVREDVVHVWARNAAASAGEHVRR